MHKNSNLTSNDGSLLVVCRYHTLEPTGEQGRATLTELFPHTTYSITVQAYNRAGAGVSSDAVTATTHEDGEQPRKKTTNQQKKKIELYFKMFQYF